MRSKLLGAAILAASVFSVAAPAAQATVPPSSGYWNWCQNTSRLCVWPNDNYSGTGSAWLESDSNWHNGDGNYVADKDSSMMNYSNYSVAAFEYANHSGCTWTVSHGHYDNEIAWNKNDKGSSHKRYTVSPC